MFGFETLPDPVAPTLATDDILKKQNVIRALWTTLGCGLMAVLWLGFSVESVAMTEAYVADGGIFGCPVPLLDLGAK